MRKIKSIKPKKNISEYRGYLANKERAQLLAEEQDEQAIPMLSDVLDAEEYVRSLDEEALIKCIEDLGEVKELDDLKDFVLKQIKFLLKYGTVRERIILLRELLKYLYPQKKQTTVNFSGGVNLVINPKIAGIEEKTEVKELDAGDRDNLSEDG